MKRVVFISGKTGLIKIWWRNVIGFFWGWISDCNFICSTWKFTDCLFMLIESWFADMPWDQWFCWFSWNLFSNSFIKMGSKAACFSLFIGLCLVSVPECRKLFAINWACTAPCSRALFSAHAVLIAQWCDVVAEQRVHAWGLGQVAG